MKKGDKYYNIYDNQEYILEDYCGNGNVLFTRETDTFGVYKISMAKLTKDFYTLSQMRKLKLEKISIGHANTQDLL